MVTKKPNVRVFLPPQIGIVVYNDCGIECTFANELIDQWRRGNASEVCSPLELRVDKQLVHWPIGSNPYKVALDLLRFANNPENSTSAHLYMAIHLTVFKDSIIADVLASIFPCIHPQPVITVFFLRCSPLSEDLAMPTMPFNAFILKFPAEKMTDDPRKLMMDISSAIRDHPAIRFTHAIAGTIAPGASGNVIVCSF